MARHQRLRIVGEVIVACRFESYMGYSDYATVVELVDTRDLKSLAK